MPVPECAARHFACPLSRQVDEMPVDPLITDARRESVRVSAISRGEATTSTTRSDRTGRSSLTIRAATSIHCD